jgi:hypothetical protein
MRRNAGSLPGKDPSMRIEELLKKIHVLIVDVFYLVFSEVALFGIHNF